MPKKADFNITIRNGNDLFYSTHDLIQGHVSLKFEKDTVVDDLCVTLEGKATIRIENHTNLLNNAGYIAGDHTFLRMSQPIQSIMLPEDHLARRGECYVIPFNFTVPETLLPYACSHGTADENVVTKAHLLLPPSLGVFKTLNILINDVGPKGTEVRYNVHASIRKRFYDGTSVLLEAAKRVRIIPTRQEEPPISIKEDDPYYRLSQEKNVYRGTSTIGKLVGRLVAEITQLSSLKLPHPRADAGGNPPTLTAAVRLRFYPASQRESPPQLGSITSKLRSFTFLGPTANKMLPRPGDCHADTAEHTQYLATYNLGATAWVKNGPRSITAKSESMEHVSSSDVARTPQTPSPSSLHQDQLSFYATSLKIPIRLPQSTSNPSKQKFFVPSFSSCIVSRAYGLELTLSYKGVSATSESSTNVLTTSASLSQYLTPQSHLLLRLPLQISVGAGPSSSSPSPRMTLTSQSHVLRHQEDGQVEDSTSEPARQFSAYCSPNADAESLQPGADQRTMLTETRHLGAVLSSNPGTAPIPRSMIDGDLDNLAAEERPPAYDPAFWSR